MSELVKALDKAEVKDLVSVRSQLAELERKVRTLKQLEKVLQVRLGEGAAGKSNGQPARRTERAEAIYSLIQEHGPMRTCDVANRLRQNQQAVAMVVKRCRDLEVNANGKIQIVGEESE